MSPQMKLCVVSIDISFECIEKRHFLILLEIGTFRKLKPAEKQIGSNFRVSTVVNLVYIVIVVLRNIECK